MTSCSSVRSYGSAHGRVIKRSYVVFPAIHTDLGHKSTVEGRDDGWEASQLQVERPETTTETSV